MRLWNAALFGAAGLAAAALLGCVLTVPVASADEVTARQTILSKAQAWVDAGVPYSQTGHKDGYRTDCSGMVSMALGLDPAGLTTYQMLQVADPISKDELQPGDILNNATGGGNRDHAHVVIFAGWTDESHTRYKAYEEMSPDGAKFTHNMPYPYWDGYSTSEYQPLRPKSLKQGGQPSIDPIQETQPSECVSPKVLVDGTCTNQTPKSCGPGEQLVDGQCIPFVCLGGGACNPSGGSPPKTTDPPNLPQTPVCGKHEELVGGHCKLKKTGCEAEGFECSRQQVKCAPHQERGSDGECREKQQHCDDNEYLDHGRCRIKPMSCKGNEIADGHGGCKEVEQPFTCGGTEGQNDKPCPVEGSGKQGQGEKRTKEDLSEYDRQRCADGKLGKVEGCTPNR